MIILNKRIDIMRWIGWVAGLGEDNRVQFECDKCKESFMVASDNASVIHEMENIFKIAHTHAYQSPGFAPKRDLYNGATTTGNSTGWSSGHISQDKWLPLDNNRYRV